ncbi:MAG: DNA-binding XRE family transcriptional regulator [Alteromonadaceae bacterium]|jgi:DNA-binding XRE family transcriptional regulator
MAQTFDWANQMPQIDKLFYQALGKRIASHRKELGLTQTKLAQALDISQQTMAHYEVGRLRISVELLTTLAKVLSVNVETLLEEPTPQTATKRGPTSLLQKQIEQISLMPRGKQKFINEMLDALIKQQQSA